MKNLVKRAEDIPVSIIMPSYGLDGNEKVTLSLLKQKYKNKEIIIINDNPEYKISPKLSGFFKKHKVKIVNNPKNLGIAESLNVGIKNARTNTIIIFCKDYLPENKFWLKHVVQKLYSDKKIGCVLSNIVWPTEVWKNYDFLTKIFTFRHINRPLHGGGNYKKEVFNKLGIFNSKKFRFAGEDCDMHARMQKNGYRIGYVEDKIIHLHYEKKGNFLNMIKKEFRYGVGHGNLKRKYGILKRMGWLDFEIRVLLILGIIFGFFIKPIVGILCFSIFLLAALFQGISGFIRTKWLPGLLFFPLASLIILFVQTIGAIKGFLKGE